ncbi:N-acetylglucosamine-6-phosphate deacetylase [Loktanella sp. Alg231-35]|uniref:N-acetylglucosamine-6-phosphate deacetylase n=1 Tax=Loktanella sp. Alg231-35 TaxID=1922220 RepID=UPI000D559251|nr:N-acetylglucosamine-6-phosphate deacetylase [Loktanella sp. Alg231-35]
MTEHWICPDRLFDGKQIISGVSLRLQDGKVTALSTDAQDGNRLPGCLSPGFVDLQVNGGGGVLLNAAPTRATMATIAAAHRQFGTVAILPTVITDQPEVLEQAADAVLAAMGDTGIIGLHIEGPHISVERRGTHEASFVRPMDDHTMAIVARLRAADVPVMITLAPEAATVAQVAALSAMGAVVSIGHTNGTAEQIEETIAAGASCGTHLFNAMSTMQSRAPGAIGAILNAGVHFGVICDGHHVDYRMIQLALRAAAKPDRAFLVSDAMATIGGADQFDLYGRAVHLEDGRLINAEGNLAGAHVTQAEGVQRLVAHVGTSLDEALRMAVTIPANLMGQSQLSEVINREVSDLIVLSDDLSTTSLAGRLTGSRGALNAAE